jgi:hypothetical protein
MRTIHFALHVILVLFLLFLIGCGLDKNPASTGGSDDPPVTILSPPDSSWVFGIETIIVAVDSTVEAEKIEFFVDDSLVGADFNSPWVCYWDAGQYVENSYHTINALAYEDSNVVFQSRSIQVKKKLDSVPPDRITDLLARQTTPTSVTLQWTVPPDNAPHNSEWTYEIMYSASPINACNWPGAVQCSDEPVPLTPGTQQFFIQFFIVENLEPNRQYFFAIVVKDRKQNRSEISNCVAQISDELEFSVKVELEAQRSPCAIATGDFDKDGDIDIISANVYSSSLSYFKNKGDVIPLVFQKQRRWYFCHCHSIHRRSISS